MTVIRRLDAVIEPTKEKVLMMKSKLDDAAIFDQHAALCHASGEAFYNTSNFMYPSLVRRLTNSLDCVFLPDWSTPSKDKIMPIYLISKTLSNKIYLIQDN